MADPIVKALSSNQTTGESRCTKPFLLCELQEGKSDKLGHIVEDILWMGRNYAIYRTERGVYLHFSDVPAEEADQRSRFTDICPELCELRYFTSQCAHLLARDSDHDLASASPPCTTTTWLKP